MLVRTFPARPDQVARVREEACTFLGGHLATDDAVLVVAADATR